MRLFSPSVVVALLLMLLSGWAGWQAQGYRLGERHALELAGRDQVHANTLDEIARAAEASKRAEQGKRLALEQKLLACVIASLLLICGCQSYSTQALSAVPVECLPPPPPAAWFMQPASRT